MIWGKDKNDYYIDILLKFKKNQHLQSNVSLALFRNKLVNYQFITHFTEQLHEFSLQLKEIN